MPYFLLLCYQRKKCIFSNQLAAVICNAYLEAGGGGVVILSFKTEKKYFLEAY
jgi:hypothetical protein